MKTIAITGGTGLVGKAASKALVTKGYEVILFTRSTTGKVPPAGCSYAQWDPELQICDVEALRTADAIVHLAGEPVAAKRWTTEQKGKITSSRVNGTRFLVSKIREHAVNCKTFIASSAIGFYGADTVPPLPFTENAPAATDFLGTTSRNWEEESQKANDFLRTVILRTGIVLANESGAFPEFVKPTRFGVLPIPGNGMQVVSWIHITDLAQLIVYALENRRINGIYNAVAPAPVSNNTLMNDIKNAINKGVFAFHVPSFLLQLVLGEMSTEVLKSCTVSAAKTLDTGFKFRFADSSNAVKDLIAGR
jgi:uncharacterized protein